MGGTVWVEVHHSPLLLSSRLSLRKKKKKKSIVQMMRQTDVKGREEGRGTELWTRVEKKENDSKVCGLSFLVSSRPLIWLSAVPCCLEVRLGLAGL